MRLKHIYLMLCVAAVVLGYSKMIPYFIQADVEINDFIKPLFSDLITQFYMMDLLVTAAVAILFILAESKRIGLRNWWMPVAGIFLVGISLGLPLFLYLRQVHLEGEDV